MDNLIAWAAWLEASALGEQMRSSALLYPALNLLHSLCHTHARPAVGTLPGLGLGLGLG